MTGFRVSAHPFPGEGDPVRTDHPTIDAALAHLAELAADVVGGVTQRLTLTETPRTTDMRSTR